MDNKPAHDNLQVHSVGHGGLQGLVRSALVYGLSSGANSAIGLLLIPVYTRVLTIGEYGILEVNVVTIAFASVVMQMGIGAALFKYVLSAPGKPDEETVISTAYFSSIAIAALLCCSFLLVSKEITHLLFGSGITFNYVAFGLLISAFETANMVPMARLRIRGKAAHYSTILVCKSLVTIALNIWFVVFLRAGVPGLMIANLIQSILFSVVNLLVLGRELKPVFDLHVVRGILRYGFPLVFMGFAMVILNLADRYYLAYYSTMREIGIYALGCKVANVVMYITAAFQLAWPRYMFVKAGEDDANQFYSRVFSYLVFVLCSAALALIIFSREIVSLVAPESYGRATRIIAIIALSNVLYGVFYATSIGTNLKQRTEYQAMAVVFGAVMNLIMNMLLIPRFGAFGAAIATGVGLLCMTVVNYVASNRLYRVVYNWGRMSVMFMIFLVLCCLSFLVNEPNTALRLFVKIVLLLAFPLGCYVFGGLDRNEVKKVFLESIQRATGNVG